MGWEWRIFFPLLTDDVFDVFKSLNIRCGFLGVRRPERRTDLYIPGASDIGIKLRNFTHLEIKLTDRTGEFGCKWLSKVVRKSCKVAGRSSRDILDIVVKEISALEGRESSQNSIKDAIELLNKKDLPFVQLVKARVTGFAEEVDVEQTDITASVQYDGCVIGSVSHWRTISFEGDPKGIKSCIEKSRIIDVVGRSGVDVSDAVMSYAMFVDHLLTLEQQGKSTK